MTTPADALGVLDVARELGMTPDAVRSRIKRGTLPAHKVDGRWMVYRSDLAEIVAELAGPAGFAMPTAGLGLAERTARAEAQAETLASEVEYLRRELTTMQGEREAEYRRHARDVADVRDRAAAALEAERARFAEALSDMADERTRVLALLARLAPALPPGNVDDDRGDGPSWWRRLRGE